MGSADDGHAPLLQGFGDFRNGGAKLPLPVLAADANVDNVDLLFLQPLYLFHASGILCQGRVGSGLIGSARFRKLAAVAAHEGDKLQRLFPIARKGSLPLGKIIAINGILAFCYRINKNILIVWNICPKCSAAAGKVRSQGAGIPFGKKYENVFSRRRQSADIAGVPFLLRRSTQRHIQHHHDTESHSKKQGPDVGVFSL